MATGLEFKIGDVIPTEIGGYVVEDLLGEGGMGTVYRVVPAEGGRGRRQKALKTIHPELMHRSEIMERFLAEGRVLSEFDHTNIIEIDGVYTMLSAPPRPFILMELLKGFTLRSVMDKSDGPLAVQDACIVATGICNALEEIHRRNMIHRDIKPENIYIQKRGKKDTRVVLIDFGIMKQILGEGDAHTTNVFLGSFSNASREQLLGQPITAKSDVYSLGVVLYEMLAGHPIFPDLTEPHAIGQAHISRAPVPLQLVAPSVPSEIAAIVMKALEKEPELRPTVVGLRGPFINVHYDIIRDQVVGAGNSTIERLFSRPMSQEGGPAEPSATGTARLPPLSATTVPTVMFSGTLEELAPLTDPGGLAKQRVQAPNPTVPADVARTTDPTALAPRNATQEAIALPLRRPNLPLLVAAGAILGLAVTWGGAHWLGWTSVASAPSPTVTAERPSASPVSVPAPLPVVPPSEPPPPPPRAATAEALSTPPPSSPPAAPPSDPPAVPVRPSHATARPANHTPKASGDTPSFRNLGPDADLFEALPTKPAASGSTVTKALPSASAAPKPVPSSNVLPF